MAELSTQQAQPKEELQIDERTLVRAAMEARQKAYTPYSNFRVGAALLTAEGRLYQGCNVENASYGATNCAERTAFFKAVSEGERQFQAIAIAGGPNRAKKLKPCAPCGICRQVMMEFCDPETFRIILVTEEVSPDKNGPEWKSYTLKELLPLGFGPGNLEENDHEQ